MHCGKDPEGGGSAHQGNVPRGGASRAPSLHVETTQVSGTIHTAALWGAEGGSWAPWPSQGAVGARLTGARCGWVRLGGMAKDRGLASGSICCTDHLRVDSHRSGLVSSVAAQCSRTVSPVRPWHVVVIIITSLSRAAQAPQGQSGERGGGRTAAGWVSLMAAAR